MGKYLHAKPLSPLSLRTGLRENKAEEEADRFCHSRPQIDTCFM